MSLLAPRRIAWTVFLCATAALFVRGPALAQGAPPVPVSIARATVQDVPVLQRGLGTVQALNNVLVRARVDGTLDHVAFTEGQEVAAGDILAVIDPRPYQAALDQARAKKSADEAQLANAKLDLQRYSTLMHSEFASRQSVDTQHATVAQLTANLQGDDAAIATAALNLSFCEIRSPIAGRVGLRMVDPGNLIHATDAQGIVTVAQIHPISVVFTLPQDALPLVQDAMAEGPLKATAATGDDKIVLGDGTLLTPDNTIDTSTGTIRLKATFPNDNGRLWPGQFVNVRLTVGTIHNAVTVPSTAVQHGPDGLYIYVAKDDDTVARQVVRVRQDDGKTAVVTEGIAAGERVVTAGQSRLQAGMHVTASQANDTAQGGNRS
jgi:multidrug efflux system membrane fusion protein